LTVLVRCHERRLPVPGIVDSGADGTLLPIEVAQRLGIEDGLVPNRVNAGAAGGLGFPTWKSPEEIYGRVVAARDSGPQEWGPQMRLVPAFAHTPMALFGRADFFKAFTITFQQHVDHGAVFMLDCS
jgi:hypothetical protein